MTLSPGDAKYEYGRTVTLELADGVTRDDVAGRAVTFNANGKLELLTDNSSVLVGTVSDTVVDDNDGDGGDGYVTVQVAGLPVVVETADDSPVAGDYLQPAANGLYDVIADADTSTIDALEGRPFVLGPEDAVNTNPRPRSDKNDRNLYVAVFR